MTEAYLADLFGPTFQGEGPSLGRRSVFVRWGGCNLHCVWCDQPETWDARRFDLRATIARRPISDAIAFIDRVDVPLVVVTGGEPLLHQDSTPWKELFDHLHDTGREVEVETNGTIVPADRTGRVAYNVSPKLAHAGDPESRRIVPAALRSLAELGRRRAARFKFVVRWPQPASPDGTAPPRSGWPDLDEVDRLVAAFDLPRDAVWIMPEGVQAATLVESAAAMADEVLARGYNLTTRLHILLWKNAPSR